MNAIEHAARLLRNGQLVAIPTETVYGLGADAKNPLAVQKIYTVKGRPTSNPLIIHIPNTDAMSAFALDIPAEAWQLARAFWPGPLTLILKRHPSVPEITTGGQDTVALRVPNHPLTLELLTRFGGGIAAPSANRYGRISPTTAEHVREELGSNVDYILDGGPSHIGIESTIVYLADPSQTAPSILRQGSISASALSAVLGKTITTQNTRSTHPGDPNNSVDSDRSNNAEDPDIIVPGSSLSHYAPEKPLYLLPKDALWAAIQGHHRRHQLFDVLSFSTPEPLSHAKSTEPFHSTLTQTSYVKPAQPSHRIHQWITASPNPTEYAQQLYSHLRQLDKTASDCIFVECPPSTEAWLAVIDRLTRAARPLD